MNSPTKSLDVRQMPWMGDTLLQLGRMLTNDRFPHALSLEGQSGIGKELLSMHLQAWLLCARPQADGACGSCADCQLIAAGHHPDLIVLRPDSKSGRLITVAAIRALSERLALRPQRQGRQVALLLPAEAMNEAAANALLKTLEEPSGDAHLLLLSHQPARLPITVLSRCVRLRVSGPDSKPMQDWLRAQGVAVDELLLRQCAGRPLQALAAHEQGLIAQWHEIQAKLDACVDGRSTPLASAQALAAQSELALEYLSRSLEWEVAQQLQAPASLTSLPRQPTLPEAWRACRRMSTELGSGLREDLALAQVLRLYTQALRAAAEHRGLRRAMA